MCGICGAVRFDGGRLAAEDIVAMRDTMLHRGPDSDGLYLAPHQSAALGFRRLRIIDLTAAGSQPMPNEDGSIQLVYNGEIYNYRELRQRLEARGHRFRSRTDSEVIVHLYEDEGALSLAGALARPPAADEVWALVGPEGGFAPEEVAQARAAGFIACGLGPVILRAETAALACAALVRFGPWGAEG